jgi:hypothetical protein
MFAQTVSKIRRPSSPRRQIRAVDATGLHELIVRLHQDYGIPMLITENGAAYDALGCGGTLPGARLVQLIRKDGELPSGSTRPCSSQPWLDHRKLPARERRAAPKVGQSMIRQAPDDQLMAASQPRLWLAAFGPTPSYRSTSPRDVV